MAGPEHHTETIPPAPRASHAGEDAAGAGRRTPRERLALVTDLQHALARDQLEIHYQALTAIGSGQPSGSQQAIGYEALLRWHHPERGAVSPAEFIPLAEASGQIVPIGEWVLRSALAEAARWPEHLIVAVNVSAAQLRSDALLRQVIGALATTGVAPNRLELEITETVLMDERESQQQLLHSLRELGVRVALDDFGTGFSSLNYLRSFPFDKLKIDRCFVDDIAVNADTRAIVEIVLALARRFGMETIAEGVEDEAQLATLAEMGCDQVQGHLFARAVPAEALPFERRDRPRRPGTAGAAAQHAAAAIAGTGAACGGQAFATMLSGRSVPKTR